VNNAPYSLELFYKKTCPYSKKVLTYIKENKLSFKTIDIYKNETETQRLIDIGGKKQVPCLIINGKALYESDAIVTWLSEHKSDIAIS